VIQDIYEFKTWMSFSMFFPMLFAVVGWISAKRAIHRVPPKISQAEKTTACNIKRRPGACTTDALWCVRFPYL
jgi:hypothetical protein